MGITHVCVDNVTALEGYADRRLSLRRPVAHGMFEVFHIPSAEQHDGFLINPFHISLFSFFFLGIKGCLIGLNG